MAVKGREMSRRRFLRLSSKTACGLIASVNLAAAGNRPTPATGAIRLERQSTGSEIWQITAEQFTQSNIYCELPYSTAPVTVAISSMKGAIPGSKVTTRPS